MKKIFYLLSLALFISCSANKPIAQEVSLSDEPDARVETQTDAVKLAKRHLALKNRDWGDIAKVQEEDNFYRIAFETPTQEKRLIGQRVLLVNKDSGLVSVVQRR